MVNEEVLVLTLPYRLDLTVWALRRHHNNQVDHWDGRYFHRLIFVDNICSSVRVYQTDPHHLHIKCQQNLNAWQKAQLLTELSSLLGVNRDINDFYQLMATDETMLSLVKPFYGFKPPRFLSIFEAMLNAITCQQISLGAAISLLNKLAHNLGTKQAKFHALPHESQIANCKPFQLQQLGFSRQRSESLIYLAKLMLEQTEQFKDLANLSNKEVIYQLCQLPGIGPWSADYILLRGLGRLDVFPRTDSGAKRSLQTYLNLDSNFDYRQMMRLVDKWQPFAGLVYFHLLLNKLKDKNYLQVAS